MNNLLPFLTVFGLASSVEAATVLYSTSFESPTYSDTVLVGQDGWQITGTTTTTPLTVSNSATNGVVGMTTGQDANRVFTATNLTTATASSVFVSATVNLTAASAAGDYFIHFGDGGGSNFFARTYIRSATGGYQMGVTTTSGTVVYSSTVIPTGAFNILLQYNFVAGAANDTGSLFINPTTADGTGDIPYSSFTNTGTDTVGINSINLRQGGATSAPTLTIDNIVVSADLIPEPSTALLGALGVFAILRRRR